MRQIIFTAQRIVTEGYGDIGDPHEWKQSVDQQIFSATRSTDNQENIVIIGDATRDAIKGIQDRHNSTGPTMTGVTTGLPTLDARLGGLEGGRVYVVAARPGVGKTALATGMAIACAYPPHPNDPDSIGDGVVFVSVEMPRKQIALRVLSQVSRIDSNKLQRGRNLTSEEWKRLADAQQKILRMPIVIEDSSSHTPSSIRAAMRMGRRRLEERFGKRLKVKVGAVDYLQLLSSNGDNREQEIADVSRTNKSIAKDENLAMLSLAQVNREPEKRKPPIPRPDDLRESGAIEQDADVVMFIYREDYYRAKNEVMDNKAQIIVAKWRDGGTGIVRCEFEPTTTTFYEKSRNPDLEQLGDIFDNYIPGQSGEPVHDRHWQDDQDQD